MNKKIETRVIKVVYPLDKLIETKGWDDLWSKFEESWNMKSGIGEPYGELVDCGIREELPEITLNITVDFKKED